MLASPGYGEPGFDAPVTLNLASITGCGALADGAGDGHPSLYAAVALELYRDRTARRGGGGGGGICDAVTGGRVRPATLAALQEAGCKLADNRGGPGAALCPPVPE